MPFRADPSAGDWRSGFRRLWRQKGEREGLAPRNNERKDGQYFNSGELPLLEFVAMANSILLAGELILPEFAALSAT